MRPLHEFSLEPLEGPGGEPPLRSRLKRDDRATDLVVEGVQLEGAFRLDDGRSLLLLSHDSPFEEILHVYLLSEELDVRDRAEIGGAYVPGLVRDLVPGPGPRLRFSFGNEQHFELNVRESPRRWTLRSPPGVRRPGPPWRKRYLEIRSWSE